MPRFEIGIAGDRKPPPQYLTHDLMIERVVGGGRIGGIVKAQVSPPLFLDEGLPAVCFVRHRDPCNVDGSCNVRCGVFCHWGATWMLRPLKSFFAMFAVRGSVPEPTSDRRTKRSKRCSCICCREPRARKGSKQKNNLSRVTMVVTQKDPFAGGVFISENPLAQNKRPQHKRVVYWDICPRDPRNNQPPPQVTEARV